MKGYKKTLTASIVAFFVGTSCCWLSSIAIWVGGASVLGAMASFIENVQVLLLGLGTMLLATALFFYVKRRNKSESDISNEIPVNSQRGAKRPP